MKNYTRVIDIDNANQLISAIEEAIIEIEQNVYFVKITNIITSPCFTQALIIYDGIKKQNEES